MLSGPQNMPVFGDNQLTTEQKQAIIDYIQTLKAQKDPGGSSDRPARPGSRGPGHLGGRDRRDHVDDPLDRSEVMTDAAAAAVDPRAVEQPGEIDLETYRELTLEEQAARASELDGV